MMETGKIPPQYTFVVIDDDEDVREAVVRGLEGHFEDIRIHTTDSPTFGIIVIEQLLERGERIDLVITDFEMGEENGKPVVEKCLEKGVPVVLMSRGSSSPDFRATRKLVGDNFLAKPIFSHEIGPYIEKVLARAHTSSRPNHATRPRD